MKSEGQWNDVIRHKTVVYSRSLVYLQTPWVPIHTIYSAGKVDTRLCAVIMKFILILLEISNFYYSYAKITSLIKSVYVTLTWLLRSSLTESIKNKTTWLKEIEQIIVQLYPM
jgi:hypothetical protein